MSWLLWQSDPVHAFTDCDLHYAITNLLRCPRLQANVPTLEAQKQPLRQHIVVCCVPPTAGAAKRANHPSMKCLCCCSISSIVRPPCDVFLALCSMWFLVLVWWMNLFLNNWWSLNLASSQHHLIPRAPSKPTEGAIPSRHVCLD